MSESLILRVAVRWLLPLLLVFAGLLLWRGHHEPGGGFVAGLTAAGAFALHRMAHPSRSFVSLLRISPTTLTVAGLGLAVASALAGWLFSSSFFEAGWVDLHVGSSAIALGTPLAFDVGVAMVVLGFALLAVDAMETHDE